MRQEYTYYADGFEVRVRQLTFEDTVRWHTNSQKLISLDSSRSDSKWDWRKIYGLGKAVLMLGQKTRGYIATIDNIHIGIMLVTINYKCLTKKEVYPAYLWYLSKSPLLDEICDEVEEVENFRPNIPISDIMFNVLLNDISQIYDKKNSFWLHADPKALKPKKLLKFYMKKGFYHCPLKKRITSRKDDGRYLYFPLSNLDKIKKSEVEYL